MSVECKVYAAPSNQMPKDSWFRRAIVAIVLERRLPYRASLAWDRVCNFIGVHRKTVRYDGLRIRVRRQTCDENFVANIILNREYNPPGFEIHERDIVVDIGGNIGTFSILASQCARSGRVVTFEPNTENYELLRQNLALNRLNNVTAVHAAVAAQSGELTLYCADQGGFHSTIAPVSADSIQAEVVSAISLKDAFDTYEIKQCDFLKIDCEGAEYDILYSLPMDYFSRIDRIAMEYHEPDDCGQHTSKAARLALYLETVGFQIEIYDKAVGFKCGHIFAKRRLEASCVANY